jgi:DNA/RNA endonuclease YhcR with UshA esterase domain
MEDRTKNASPPPSNVREFPAETLCPSCGKFVGAYEKCPYCGTELQKRMSIIFFKRAALVLAIGGLALLWFTATHIKIPVVRVEDINARMNNAVVEVKGRVTRVSMMGRDGIAFSIDDGSGVVGARAFRGLDKIRETGNVPAVGDEVSVVGNIQVTERYGTGLMINIPSRVKVIPAVPERVTIDKVTLENRGKAVEVVGEIVAVKRIKGTTILIIGDATGTTGVPIFKSEVGRIKDMEKLTRVGNEIRLVGSVDAFRNRPQVRVRDVEKIEVLKDDTIPSKEIPGYERIREREERGMKPGAPGKGAEEDVKPAAPREGSEGETESQPAVFF